MTEVLRLAVAIQGVNNFSGAFSKAQTQIGGIRGAVAGLGAGLAAAGPAIAFFGTQMAISFAKASIEIASSFEREMLRVQAVTQATGEEYQQLTAFAEELGATTEFTARQSAEAMVIFGRASFDVNEIYEVTPVALALATAGMTDMATSGRILSNVLRGFSFGTEEAVRVADVLTFTANNSFTSIESLTESFKLSIPMASAAGIEFEELSAAIGLMGNMGIQGSMAGTGLRQAIAKLLDPSEDAIGTMSRLGVELQALSDIGQVARNELDLQLPVYEALVAEQEAMKITTRDLGLEMAGIGIETDKNNIAIQAHENAIAIITQDYLGWSDEINTLKADLLGLQDAMGDFSLDMQKNNLEIAEIRQQADREARSLSEQELARIDELSEANDELSIERQRVSIQQIELQKQIASEESSKANAIASATSLELASIAQLETANNSLMGQQTQLNLQTQETALASQLAGLGLGAQKTQIEALSSTVATQVTGTQDFVNILGQLADAGATTADFMEIFSIRGGTAMLALRNTGAEALDDFTTAVQNSGGTLDETAEIIRSGISQEVLLLTSAWEGLQIQLGAAFFPVLSSLMTQFKDLIPSIQNIVSVLPLITENFTPIITIVVDFIDKLSGLTSVTASYMDMTKSAFAIFEAFAPILDLVIDIFAQMTPILFAQQGLFASLIPVVELIVDVFTALAPVFQVLNTFQTKFIEILTAVITVVTALFEPVSTIVTILGETLSGVITGLMPIFDALILVIESTTPAFDAVNDIIEALIPLVEELAPLIVDFAVILGEQLSTFIIALIPIIELMAFQLELWVPIIELVVGILVTLLPIVEALMPLLDALIIPIQILSEVIEILTPVIEIFATVLIITMVPIILIALAIKGIIWLFQQLPGVIEPIGNFFKDAFGVVVDLWIQPVIDNVTFVIDLITGLIGTLSDLKDSISDSVIGGVLSVGGDIVGGITGVFATGTGLGGLPETGLFHGEEDEIVLDNSESNALRSLAGGGGLSSQQPQNVVTYSIAKIEINVRPEDEGSVVVKTVMDELDSLNARGDKEPI